MTAQHTAQGLASLGRNGDSMLVHMQPREVAGLQALAMAHGGSLTINPDTGMPEAFNLGKVLGNFLPVIAGGALSMTGMGPLAAGLLTGAATWAATGDPLKGVMGGFGAFGGYGLGDDLAKFAVSKTAPVAKTALVDQGTSAVANAATSTTPNMLTNPDFILNSTAGQGANASLLNAVPSAATQTAATSGTTFADLSAGTSKALSDPIGFFKSTPDAWKHGLTLASPFLSTEQPAVPLPVEEKINYDGPYTMQDRAPRMPTLEETQQMRLAGSPEFNYFGVSNPVPGYMSFAQGGTIQSGGIRDLYGTSDNQLNSPPLSRNGYGLGRLDSMYGMSDTPPAPVSVMASGGPVSFEAGGAIPAIGATPEMSQAAQASYAVAPTNLAEVAAIDKEDISAPGISGLSALNRQASQATNDPMGRLGRLGSGGMSFEDMMALRTNPLENMERVLPPMARASLGPYFDLIQARRQREVPAAPAAPTMQDYIRAANRTPLQAAASPTGAEQQYFNQVNPQPVQAAQGGIMSLARGGRPSPGGYLDGPGDGMSDSIPATIEGKHPARLADGEFVIPADVVSHLGNGSTKAGAKVLYGMMDKVRKARTGNKKQGRQINPRRFVPA